MRNFFITIFTPAARHMERVNPTVFTMISLGAGILAGFSYVGSHISPWFYILGGVFLMVSGTADSLDGIVARMYGKTSKTGDFLDHFCDRLVDIAILVGLTFSSGANMVLGFSLAILVLLNSYLGTQIEATLGKRSYEGTGKAEFFVGFILFSLLAGIFPGLSLEIAGLKINFTDIFMGAVLTVTLFSLGKRFFLGIKASIDRDEIE